MVSIGRPPSTLLLGPAKSGKTQAVFREFLSHAAALSFSPANASALLLAPSRSEARRLRGLLAAQGKPLFASGVVALEDLAQSILEHNGITRSGLDEGKRFWLLRGILCDLSARDRLRALKGLTDNDGFLEQLAGFFAELKHAEIFYPQLKEGLRRKGPDPKDQEILEIYAEYQRLLVDHDLFDQEGILWKAKVFLEKSPLAALPQALWVDGFETFSPAQIEFLKTLARAARVLCVTLTLDDDPAREGLFRRAQETRKDLVAALKLKEIWQPAPSTDGPLLLCRDLFRPGAGTEQPKTEKPKGVFLREAPSLLMETRRCAAEIKRRLADNPEAMRDIAVCARNLDAYRESLKQEFLRHGIPLRMAYPLSLDRTQLGRFALAFLQVHAQANAQTLLAVLHSGLVDCPETKALDCELLERRLEAGSIRDFSGTWKKRLEYAGKDAQLPERTGKLLAKVSAWPAKQSLLDHWKTFRAQWRAWGIPGQILRVAREGRPELADQWNTLSRALEEYGGLASRFGKEEPVPIAAFLKDFSQFMHRMQWNPRRPADGIAVIEAHAMRGLSFDTVFLLGLNEGVFPSLGERRSLHSREERQRMREADIFLEDEGDRENREAFLFYRVIASARKSLFVSWHGLPSSYAVELRRLTDAAPAAQDAPENVRNPSHWASPEDALAALGLHLFSGKTRRPAYFPELLERWEKTDAARITHLKTRAGIEHQREYRRGFSPMDGQFRDGRLIDIVAEKMGPDSITSASRLGEYAKCPFRFYSKYLLNIDPPSPRRTELDAREQGILLHDILWRLYHRHFQEKRHGSVAEAFRYMTEDAEAVSAMVFAGFEQEHGILQPAIWSWEKNRLTEGVKALLRYEERFFQENPQRVPAYFELSFGPLDGDGADPSSRKEPVTLRLGNQKLRLKGRIDRLDLERIALPSGGEAAVYWILDYKSGHPPVSPAKIRSGQDVQLPLYLLAAEKMLESLGVKAIAAGAGLLEIFPPKLGGKFHKKMKPKKGVLEDAAWEKDLASSKEWIFRHAQDIGRGRFTPTPNPVCETYCPYRSMCRFDERRIARKTSGMGADTAAIEES